MTQNETAVCPASRAIDLLQEKWVLHIVRSLLEGPRGFNELSRAIGGCNTATLAQRLDHLEALGVIRRTVHSMMPPRTSYALTPVGVELQAVVVAIDRWARKHLRAETPAAAQTSRDEERKDRASGGPARRPDRRAPAARRRRVPGVRNAG